MANRYQITVKLDNATLNVLQNGWALQVFKGAKAASSAQPTVWAAIDQFSNQMTLSWTEQYGGYVSNQQLTNGLVVDASSSQTMDLGNVMTLNADGSTSVTTGGTPGAITITSLEKNEWLCGMTQSVNGSAPSAICAFPLYGQTSDLMEPYEKIVLMFASSPVDTGTVVEEAISQAAVITLSGDTPQASLSFSINTGWNAGTNPYISILPPQSSLAEVLIVPIAGKGAKKESKHLPAYSE